jgi:hypothetical protein
MKNALYSIHVDLLDGRSGKGSGVVIFRDGQILGGDAYLYYSGSYVVNAETMTFRGEVTVMSPLFGGQQQPVGIGVTGTYTDDRATMNGTALVGKHSQLFRATLRRLADTE